MERRLELLEQDLRDLRNATGQTRADVSFIKGKLDDMPTKDWMNTRLIAVLSLLLVAMGLMIRFVPGL